MTNLACLLMFIHLFEVYAELNLTHLTENQSLELSCSLQRDLGSLSAFSLYHRSAQSQTTVLSMAEGGKLRVNSDHRGRLQLRGGLDSPQVNVTISHLQHSDTGLYLLELSYKNNNSDATFIAQRVFLLVEGAGIRSCYCSRGYLPLLLTIFTAAGLLLLTLSWLAIEKCAKHRHRPSLPAPIYEEMTRKQQSAEIPQNNHEAPSHLEEVHFPVYANPSIRQPQDNYYACPRQLALRA
ncbi:uncharacterized protein LOC113148948 [Anabas testudineus]|uniref:uncharacterized protein LOC113148948 n=1 Tax=Anabas testudineus TaxID=64144 RepID=UPI000E453C34|nr:uncharacterized protein LOC113148948 [Anabas testudineus]